MQRRNTATGSRSKAALREVLARLALVALGLATASCASVPKAQPQATLAPTAPMAGGACDPARDRSAILAMVGTFAVTFEFDETQALTPGYKLEEPYHTEATEVVSVLENSERRVVLQHVLLLEKHNGEWQPQKHWRQDWTFEDPTLVEFQGQRVWRRRTLNHEEVRCTWSQAVFEVDDGPRYESYGRFVHTSGPAAQSEWTSQLTWRPLPRREYTQRRDYDVLVGTNRHVMTAQGFRHEQDNVKLVLEGQRQLARERGLNQYRRVEVAETALAQHYLEQTGAFWSDVRAEWQALLDASPAIVVQREHAGKPLYERLFPLASASASVTPNPARDEQRSQIHATIADYVQATTVALQVRAPQPVAYSIQ